jgi:proteasome lid subunit RPN8/RPN11
MIENEWVAIPGRTAVPAGPLSKRRLAKPDLPEEESAVLQTLVASAGRFINDLGRAWIRERNPVLGRGAKPALSAGQQPLRHVTLTDEVCRSLFEEYAGHRRSHRGNEETGWVLMGVREADEAIVLATLPAGAHCSAGVAHVQFNSSAQALGSLILRQRDRRLAMLGVVHTHPGSLRHPSDGDYQGDRKWVNALRGGEGVFGIGTVDARARGDGVFARQPRPHMQALGELSFCWYALGKGDPDYRPLPYRITLGPDLARPLHPVWSSVELYAEQLERLFRQQAGVTIDVVPGTQGSALSIRVPLIEPYDSIRIMLEGSKVLYYLLREDDVLEVAPKEERVDRAVYLLLAELAAQG